MPPFIERHKIEPMTTAELFTLAERYATIIPGVYDKQLAWVYTCLDKRRVKEPPAFQFFPVFWSIPIGDSKSSLYNPSILSEGFLSQWFIDITARRERHCFPDLLKEGGKDGGSAPKAAAKNCYLRIFNLEAFIAPGLFKASFELFYQESYVFTGRLS